MYLIRKLSVACAMGLLAGCQVKQSNPPAAVERPGPADEATRLRDWDSTSAYYRNGGVQSNPDRFMLQSSNANWATFTDTPIFLANTVLLPFSYIRQGPSTEVTNSAGGFNPSYTGGVAQAQADLTANNTGALIDDGRATDFGGTTPKVSPIAPGKGIGAGRAVGGSGAGPSR